eukprot:5845862-Amphidinium_carterae.1
MYGERRALLGHIIACISPQMPSASRMVTCRAGQSVFSKDDPIAMDFVHCAANLRMENYRIGRLSRLWSGQRGEGAVTYDIRVDRQRLSSSLTAAELCDVVNEAGCLIWVKEARSAACCFSRCRWDAQSIAGSIIPAVASTNAIVAGLEVRCES